MLEAGIFGTCKIKDGLYIGDIHAAQDLEFIILNKVAFIVNTASEQLGNLWESFGVTYLAFSWPEDRVEAVLEFIDRVFAFIEDSVHAGDSCLIQSVHGQSRACSVAAIYLMRKFGWSLFKTLEYLSSRRNDLEIKACFFELLGAVERRLMAKIVLSQGWANNEDIGPEEQVVVNTFKNGHSAGIDVVYTSPDCFQQTMQKVCTTKVKWSEVISDTKPNRHMKHVFKSSLKGSKKVFMKAVPAKVDIGQKGHKQQLPNAAFIKRVEAEKVQAEDMQNNQPEEEWKNKFDAEKENSKPARGRINWRGGLYWIAQLNGLGAAVQPRCAEDTRQEEQACRVYESQIEQIRRMLANSSVAQFGNFMEPAIDDSRPLIEQRDASVRPLSKEKETLHVAVRPVIPNKRSISNPKAAKADIPTKSIPEKVKPKQHSQKHGKKEMSNRQRNQVVSGVVALRPRMPEFNV